MAMSPLNAMLCIEKSMNAEPDGEPVGAGRECGGRCLADVDRPVVKDEPYRASILSTVEAFLINLFPAYGWRFEGVDACVMREQDGRSMTVRDGTQVWRNTTL
jgi:hypothetical protein